MPAKLPSLRQLQCLLEVSRTLHFGEAARRCGITQPSLSAQVQALEDVLNIRLVERSRSGVTLTPAGREIASRAAAVMDEVGGIRDFAEAAQSGTVGTIRLGTMPTLGPYMLPQVVARLHREYPSLRLHIRDALPRELEDELRAGVHDTVLVQLPVAGDDLVTHRLFREPLLLAMAADDPLARYKSVPPEKLEGRSVLGMRSGYHLHDRVRTLCEQHSARLLREYEGTSLDALRQMVGMGVGLSFLPALYIQSEVEGRSDVVARPLSGPAITRSIGLVWRKRSGHTRILAEIAKLMRAVARDSFRDITLES